ncbi:MAG TPA: TolC family protein [Vicinamibacterales bacterium]
MRRTERQGARRGVPGVSAGLALGLGLLVLGAAHAHGQAAQAGLKLEEVVRRALRSNPGIELARQELHLADGRLVAAGAPFDLVLEKSVSAARSEEFAPGAVPGPAAPTLRSTVFAYEVSALKHLSNGVTLRPSVSITRSALQGANAASNVASVDLTVSVPLLRDRWGSVTAAPERSAEALRAARELDLRHAAAAGVLEAVSAYWNYLAAQRRLEVHLATERRAELLVEETRLLVEAEERAASDLDQVLANLAAKRAARISAEQAVLEARRALGLAMGIDAASALSLGPPADDFPSPPGPESEVAWDTTADQAAVERALARRPDLASGRQARRSAAILVAASEAAARPALDLSLGLGYAGMGTGNSFDHFLDPLYRGIPGLNASVYVTYRHALADRAARGALLQQEAALEQARILETRLERQVATGVRVAAEALRRSVRALAEAGSAVAHYRRLVEAEKERHRLGASTLFDVILAEDALTSALLTEVSSRTSYAVAIAAFHFETGTLVNTADLSVSVQALLTPP